MTISWGTLALQIVNFLVLVWLLQRFLYKPVLRVIDARRREIDEHREAARKAEETARAAQEAVDAERARIADERAAALKDAGEKARAAAEERRKRAEEEAAALVADGRRQLAAERDAALARARVLALDLGTEMARRLVAELPEETRALAWLARVEEHVAGLPATEREALSRGSEDGEIRVVTAAHMPKTAEDAWRERLPAALGHRSPAVAFDVDPALVAGVEVHLPFSVIRFSFRSVLEELGRKEAAA